MTAIRAIAPPLPERQAEPDAPPAVPGPAEAPPATPPAVDDTTQLPPRHRRRRMAALLLLIGALVALTALIIWYLLFRQPLPLPLIPDTQLPAYSAAIYGMDRPTGVAVSASGDRIYVSETDGDRIVRIFDGRGDQVGTMRPGPEITGSVPVYLAIDPLTEDVYVTDRPTGSIYIYDRDGTYLRPFEPARPRRGWQPMGIAFDTEGLMYVTNLGGGPQGVLVFDRQGEVVRTLGESEGLSFPNGVAVDRSGNVYVADSNNGRLLVFDREGRIVARIGRGAAQGNLGLPRGVVVDDKGRLFVVDTSGQGVSVYRSLQDGGESLEYLGFFGGQGVADAAFAYPIGIALDARGRVYITDSANDRVQVWSY
jgi:DNA-binding beta-propeller fold protein YncE